MAGDAGRPPSGHRWGGSGAAGLRDAPSTAELVGEIGGVAHDATTVAALARHVAVDWHVLANDRDPGRQSRSEVRFPEAAG